MKSGHTLSRILGMVLAQTKCCIISVTRLATWGRKSDSQIRTYLHLAIGRLFKRGTNGIGSDTKIPELWMRVFRVWHRSRRYHMRGFDPPPRL
jgi:hypothetical protein